MICAGKPKNACGSLYCAIRFMAVVCNQTRSNSEVCRDLFNTYYVQSICARESETNQKGPILPQGVPVWERRQTGVIQRWQVQLWERDRISEALFAFPTLPFLGSCVLLLPFWLFAVICCSPGGNYEHIEEKKKIWISWGWFYLHVSLGYRPCRGGVDLEWTVGRVFPENQKAESLGLLFPNKSLVIFQK